MAARKTFLKETEKLRDLRALEAIERDPHVSQRELANTLDVAVGVANACIRTLARKGLVKIRGTSNRSITYHLTKAGVLHKSMLAMEWTRNTVDFYVQARGKVAEHLGAFVREGVRSIVLDGANELAEIAVLVSAGAGVEVVGILRDEGSAIGSAILRIPVEMLDGLELAEEPDAVVFCRDPEPSRIHALTARFPAARLLSLVGEMPVVPARTDGGA